MITVEEALKIIDSNTVVSKKTESLSLSDALGFVLSEEVISPMNMPPFRQSAMDGYAISVHDSKKYKVVGEIKAGDGNEISLSSGQAVRIFTGAPVPQSANAVVIQEKVIRTSQQIELQQAAKEQSNIRPLGEQIKRGEKALNKGTSLTPAAIGFITTLGITEVEVYKKPSVGIIVTGNELIEAGKKLDYGQIYESNSLMLSSALQKSGHRESHVFKVPDDFESTLELLNQVIRSKDMVLISGGISVGDYDFVGRALEELKVDQLFYKIKQKPGKPLFFGKKDDAYIFALPGNPAAALSCFYIYVLRCLEGLSGNPFYEPILIKASSVSDYIRKGGRAQFLKAHYKNGSVEILEGQSSSMLHTFAVANALVYVSIDTEDIKKGDEIELILLP